MAYTGIDTTQRAAAFLQRNPHALAKYGRGYWGRPQRREPMSGCFAVHSTEGLPDRILPDDGAENTRDYFGHSTRPASYHKITDSDSIVNYLPWSAEAYHDGTGGNRHSGGVSMATQAHRWGQDPAHDDKLIRNAAVALADGMRYWASLRRGRDPMQCARWITPEQYKARQPGMVEHGQLDPRRRSDPWTTHPFRPELRRRLLAYVIEELGGNEEDDMEFKDWSDESKDQLVAKLVPALTKSVEDNVARKMMYGLTGSQPAKPDLDSNEWANTSQLFNSLREEINRSEGSIKSYVTETVDGLQARLLTAVTNVKTTVVEKLVELVSPRD